MTVQEWLDIHMDMDAYIAKGGQLLDLPVANLNLPVGVQQIIADRLGPEKSDRIGRFYDRVSKHMTDKGEVGDQLTEDLVRAIWRETAGPFSDATH